MSTVSRDRGLAVDRRGAGEVADPLDRGEERVERALAVDEDEVVVGRLADEAALAGTSCSRGRGGAARRTRASEKLPVSGCSCAADAILPSPSRSRPELHRRAVLAEHDGRRRVRVPAAAEHRVAALGVEAGRRSRRRRGHDRVVVRDQRVGREVDAALGVVRRRRVRPAPRERGCVGRRRRRGAEVVREVDVAVVDRRERAVRAASVSSSQRWVWRYQGLVQRSGITPAADVPRLAVVRVVPRPRERQQVLARRSAGSTGLRRSAPSGAT